jgi:creatinine amidohydrolase/Fe(II)-dependent formamide hydrolase-like protein
MPRHPDRLIERLSQPAAAALISASGTAVVATGSVEQHGGHLPLGTDAFAATSIAERVAARLGTVVASLGPAGVAPYHLPNATASPITKTSAPKTSPLAMSMG